MPSEPKATEATPGSYVLPRYLRFARTLALVSGTTIGIAAGVAVISSGGCSCNGICGGQAVTMGTRPYVTDAADVGPDVSASGDAARPDVIVDAGSADTGNGDAGTDDASDTGGGPRPAPLLPRAWIA